MVKEKKSWPVTEEAAFEMWLRLSVKDLRILQRQIQHLHQVKIPMTVLSAWRDRNDWVERGFRMAMTLEAEVNRAAFETIQGRLVRNRADSMMLVSEIYNEMLKKTALLVQSDVMHRYYTGNMASPKVLLDSLTALEKLARVYQTLLPPTRHSEDGDVEADTAIPATVDPLRLAEQLTAMVNRPRVQELVKIARATE